MKCPCCGANLTGWQASVYKTPTCDGICRRALARRVSRALEIIREIQEAERADRVAAHAERYEQHRARRLGGEAAAS